MEKLNCTKINIDKLGKTQIILDFFKIKIFQFFLKKFKHFIFFSKFSNFFKFSNLFKFSKYSQSDAEDRQMTGNWQEVPIKLLSFICFNGNYQGEQ